MRGYALDKRDARNASVALVVTLAIQAFTSLAATTPAVLAPELAEEMGISASWIGVFVGLVYAGAMLSSVVSIGFMERYGALRVSQVCVILCAAGIAMVGALPASAAPLLAGAAVLLGLGYGPITPASSQILIRTTEPSRMAPSRSIPSGTPTRATLRVCCAQLPRKKKRMKNPPKRPSINILQCTFCTGHQSKHPPIIYHAKCKNESIVREVWAQILVLKTCQTPKVSVLHEMRCPAKSLNNITFQIR